MSCQSTGCTEAAPEIVVILGAARELCEHHARAAVAWLMLDDPAPPPPRTCVLCAGGERAPGRAICWRCMAAAYNSQGGAA